MSDRFDLEQQITECWGVVNDIELLNDLNANPETYKSLASLYEVKFTRLWNTFEELVKEKKLT